MRMSSRVCVLFCGKETSMHVMPHFLINVVEALRELFCVFSYFLYACNIMTYMTMFLLYFYSLHAFFLLFRMVKRVRSFSLLFLFIWKRLLLVSHGKSNSRRAGFEISHRNYGRRIYESFSAYN